MFFNRPLIAIDIGSSSVKLVELSGGVNRKLARMGLQTLAPGLVQNGLVTDADKVAGSLKSILKEQKINVLGRRAALSLGGTSVMIKRIGVMKNGEAEFAQQVQYEAEQHFQADMADLYFDHYELPKSQNADGTVQVVIVGAKREVVEQHIAVIRALGMRTGVMECEVFSTTNMFEYTYGVAANSVVALMNVGASRAQLTLLLDGQYLYSRDVQMGGEEYSRRLMETLKIDRDNAENLKVAAGSGGNQSPPEVLKILTEVNEALVAEIQAGLDYFYQSGEAPQDLPPLSCIFLIGGGARTLGFDAALAAAIQVPVQIANPFQRVAMNTKNFDLDYLLGQSHLYAVAMGLSLRGMRDRI